MDYNENHEMRLWQKILLGLALFFIIYSVYNCLNKSPRVNVKDIMSQNEKLKEENKNLKRENERYISLLAELDLGEEKENEKIKEYKAGDEWIVDGQWKLKILEAKKSDERNEFSKKNPKEVVIITYTYENLGYKNDDMDGLFLMPDGVIDQAGSIGYSYPITTENYPDNIPIGSKIEKADAAFGINNESKTITVNFSVFDNSLNKQRASFKVDVK